MFRIRSILTDHLPAQRPAPGQVRLIRNEGFPSVPVGTAEALQDRGRASLPYELRSSLVVAEELRADKDQGKRFRG